MSMKKIILALIILVVLATFAMPVITAKEDDGVKAGITVAAATTQTTSSREQEQRHGADDTVTVTPTTRGTLEVEHGTETEVNDSNHTSGRTIAEVRENRHKSLENLNATLRNVSSGERDRIKNENEVRIAVTTLLDVEDLSGGIGRNVSAIARDFNNSASSVRKIEDRIQSRSSFVRLFFGGDQEAARELANQTAQNDARIVELRQLINNASLNSEVRATIEDQVRIIQLEQERLQQLSTREQKDRGLFGRFL
jgi:type II secretory pathway pseudopilin PulG